MVEIKVDKEGATCSAKGKGIEILIDSTVAVFKMCQMLKQIGGDEMVDVFTKSLNPMFNMGLHKLFASAVGGETECVQINPAELLRQMYEEGDSDAE